MAVYLMHRSESSGIRGGVTSYELWVEKKPNLKHLRIFGAEAYVNIPKQFATKFDVRAKKMILVGYEGNTSNYRVYDPVSRKMSVSRDVVFFERIGKVVATLEKDKGDEIVLPKIAEEERREEAEDDDDVFLTVKENAADERRNLVAPASPIEVRRILKDRDNLKTPSRYETKVAEPYVPGMFKEAMVSKDSSE